MIGPSEKTLQELAVRQAFDDAVGPGYNRAAPAGSRLVLLDQSYERRPA